MSKDEDFDLEPVYDELIFPLMTDIISICMEHKIPMFATFQYKQDDESYFATTNLPFVNERPVHDNILNLVPTLNKRKNFTAIVTTTEK